MNKIKTAMTTETILSDDNKRRYLIQKHWNTKQKSLAIIMLNPTKAESITVDHTTLYILKNCVANEIGMLSILNMFSTIDDCKEMGEDKENEKMIDNVCSKVDVVIYAPGTGKKSTNAFRKREVEVLDILKKYEEKLFCISDDDNNYPLHPLCPRAHVWHLMPIKVSQLLDEATK